MLGLIIWPLKKTFGLAALGANIAASAFSHASMKTKLVTGAAAFLTVGGILSHLEEANNLPPAEAPRGYTLAPTNVPPPGERVTVTPDAYGNVTIPGSLIAQVYIDTVFDVQVNNTLASMAEGPRKDELKAWADETRTILLDAITKFEDIPLDGEARRAVAEIQRRQIETSREEFDERSETFHQGMTSPSARLELSERSRLFGGLHPEYVTTEEQSNELDALMNVPQGTFRGTSIITYLTTMPPAGDLGVYTYSKYRSMVIEAAAGLVVTGERQGSLESDTPAATDHAAVTPRTQPRPPSFG